MNKKLALLVLASFMLPAAFAASLHIVPVSIQMTPGQAAATLTLRNDGDKPLNAQVRIFGWSQKGGRDELGPTSAVLASPPMIAVPPHGTQTVRLVRADKSPVTSEASYRVLIDEIADAATATDNGVNLLLRYSVPVFASPAGMKPPRVTVTSSLAEGTLKLRAQNSGGQHANVSAVTLRNAAGDSVVLEAGLVGYVLVGQTMEWTLQLPRDAAARGPFVTLHCRFNGEAFSTSL